MEQINGNCECKIHCFLSFNFVTTGQDRPTLKDLVIHVIPSVVTKWYNIGVVLLDAKHHNELTIIESDRHDVVTCCRKMFTKWLDTDALASWDKLLQALKILKLNKVAREVEQLLLQGECVTVVIISVV